MKLVVQRSGGFGGLTRRGERSGQELSGEQHSALARVIEAWESEKKTKAMEGDQPNSASGIAADQFTYRLDIEDEGGARSITLPDAMMPAELKGIVY